MRTPFQPSLLTKIVLALLAVGLVPLAWITVSLININSKAMNNQVLSSHLVAAQSIARRLDAEVERYRVLASVVVDHPLVTQIDVYTAEILTGLLVEDSSIVALRLLDPDNKLVVAATQPGQGEIGSYFPVSPESVAWTNFDDKDWLAIVVTSQSGTKIQVVADTDGFVQALDPAALGDQANVSIIDRRGTTIVGKNFFDGTAPGALAEAASSSRLSGAGEFKNHNQSSVLAAYESMRSAPWLVISSQPVAVARLISRQMWQRAWLFGGAALLLVAGISALAYQRLVRPIRVLSQLQAQIAGLKVLGSGDELNSLRESVDSLRDRARNQQELSEVFVGRYQVIEVIGRGAAGWVFRGWDPVLKRPVALKTVHFNRGNQGSTERLLAEAITVARFNHPNIVALFDVIHGDDTVFLAMEHIEGVTGSEILGTKQRKLKAPEIVAIATAVAGALSAAHREGVIHRDIKPGNLLFGFDDSIKVTDFGIATAKSVKEGAAVYGTPGYVAPEIIRAETAGPASDLFSFGVLLYLAATGEKPFSGTTVDEILHNTLAGEVIPPKLLSPIPAALSQIIECLLEKDTIRRYQSADQVAKDLRDLEEATGIEWDLSKQLDSKSFSDARAYSNDPVVSNDPAGSRPVERPDLGSGGRES